MIIGYKYNFRDISYVSNSFNILKYNNIVNLNCNNNILAHLPILPNNLIKLYCSYNNLTYLPILPNSLKLLACSDNKIITLPKLSNSLIV